jgi:hypothetical protein
MDLVIEETGKSLLYYRKDKLRTQSHVSPTLRLSHRKRHEEGDERENGKLLFRK